MSLRIACVGEAMIELAMSGNTAGVGVAGDTLNAAVYLTRANPDLQVDYITCLGDDPFSLQIRDFIENQGIGCDNISMLPGRTPGLYAITTTPEGERSFTYWRETAAARSLFAGPGEPDFSVLAGYDVVYLSGITIAILPHPVRLALIDWLVQSDVRVVFDSNFRPRLWEDTATARTITTLLWACADIALPSVDDEMDLFGETHEEVRQRFAELGVRGALKQGADGPASLGEPVSQNYPPARSVVDTTAAGDSFNGAYLGAVLAGTTQADALMAAHLCASEVVGIRGAITPRVQE